MQRHTVPHPTRRCANLLLQILFTCLLAGEFLLVYEIKIDFVVVVFVVVVGVIGIIALLLLLLPAWQLFNEIMLFAVLLFALNCRSLSRTNAHTGTHTCTKYVMSLCMYVCVCAYSYA